MSGDRGPALAVLLFLLAAAAPPQQDTPPPADPEERVLGAPSGFAGLEEERLAVPRGLRLRERPDLEAPILVQVDAASELPVLERRGEWVRLRYGVFKGWALPAGDEAPLTPAPGRRLEGADPDLVARAREVLGGGPDGALGPFLLLTDLRAPRLLARLGGLAESVRSVYRERLGLDPEPPRGEAVALFSRQADYRRFSAAETTLEGLAAHGHAGRGMAALSAEGTEEEDLAALLAHELVHLENRRTFAGDLPPWLEEGLAEDLAYSRIEADGRLAPGTLGGDASVDGQAAWAAPGRLARFRRLSLSGSHAALSRLLSAWDGPLRQPLEELVALSWYELVEPSRRPVLYPESAFFVRFLLDGGDPPLRARFRAYLAAAAAGEPAGGADLAGRLGRGWAELDAAYADWLHRQGALHLPPSP